jgi:hypothetical protein
MAAAPARRRQCRLAASVAVVGITAGNASAARARHARDTTVHVIEHAVTDTVAQSGGGKDKTGNTLTFHNKVYSRDHGRHRRLPGRERADEPELP